MTQTLPEKESYNVQETAALIGVSRRQVYYYLDAGHLVAIRRSPNSTRITAASLKAFFVKFVKSI